MDETKRNVRIRWREDSIKCFLEACIQEVTKPGRNRGSLQKDSWVRVQKQLQEACNLKVSRKQMRNEYDYLKGKYSGWMYLKGKVGHCYDPKTNSFNLTDQEWEGFLKEHPKVKKLRNSPLVFPELCSALFKRAFVLGKNRWTPSSNLPNGCVSSGFRNSPIIQPLQIEDVASNGQEDEKKILDSPNIQSQTLQIAEILSNIQEDGIQIPSSPNIQPQPLQIAEISSHSQEDGIQIPGSPIIQPQPLQIAEIPSNIQEDRIQIPGSPNIQPQTLQIAEIPSNSQDGIQNLGPPNIQPKPLQIAEIPSNSQEDGIQIPGSPNVQPQPLQIAEIPGNSQEGGTKNPSIQSSQSDTVLPSADKERPSATNSNLNEKRPKKKVKTSKKAAQLEEEMSSALRSITRKYDGPSQEECVEKLNQLGWATNSSSYVTALGIFCEGPSYRKGWMLLPIDDVELLRSWVKSIGRKLGYFVS